MAHVTKQNYVLHNRNMTTKALKRFPLRKLTFTDALSKCGLCFCNASGLKNERHNISIPFWLPWSSRNLIKTRMHSSRMRIARSSSHQGLPQCMLGYPPGCGPGDPPGCGPWDTQQRCGPEDPPGVGLKTPPRCGAGGSPPRCGPGNPPRPDPSTSSFSVGLETPQPDPSTSPLGVGLETCKACWDTTCNACWDTTPPTLNRILDTRY